MRAPPGSLRPGLDGRQSFRWGYSRSLARLTVLHFARIAPVAPIETRDAFRYCGPALRTVLDRSPATTAALLPDKDVSTPS